MRDIEAVLLCDGCAAFSPAVHETAVAALRPVSPVMTVAEAMPRSARHERVRTPKASCSRPRLESLIVGAGAAGLCAALAAHEAGADVVVVERDRAPRGSTALSAGLIPAAGTRFQRERGIADDPRTFAEDIQRKAGGDADPAIVEAVTQEPARRSNGSRTATACLLGRA